MLLLMDFCITFVIPQFYGIQLFVAFFLCSFCYFLLCFLFPCFPPVVFLGLQRQRSNACCNCLFFLVGDTRSDQLIVACHEQKKKTQEDGRPAVRTCQRKLHLYTSLNKTSREEKQTLSSPLSLSECLLTIFVANFLN